MRWLLALFLMTGCGARVSPRVIEEATPKHTPADAMQVRLDLADALIEGGNPDAALKLLSQLTPAQARRPEAVVLQVRAMRVAGLSSPAQARVAALIEQRPRSAVAHNEQGILWMDAGHIADAAAAFSRAAELEPAEPDYLNNLGFARLVLDDAAGAIDALQQALLLDGADTKIRMNLAFALISAQRPDEALELLAAAEPLAQAQYHLGTGHELYGQDADAVGAYEAALSLLPEHPGAREALQRLKEEP